MSPFVVPAPGPSGAGLRVLFVNWRDGGHPDAGGAESFVAEVATRLVTRGAQVALFVGRGPAQAAEERVAGVHTVRRGNRWTVYPHALAFLARHRDDFDMVVDCQNGLPFYSPLVLSGRTATLLLVHHVHQDQFAAHFPKPLAGIGRWLEGPASRGIYGRRAVVVVSPSTRTEVRRRLRLRGPLHVVPNGITVDTGARTGGLPEGRAPRSAKPTIVCVGRLVVHKRMERLLDALPAVLAEHPDLVLHIVGDGTARPRLQRQAQTLGLDAVVRFHGRIPGDDRDALLGAAWLTVNPSMGEGWGLGVLEAAALGVPAVAAAVPGLRDAVLPGRTGWLVPEGRALAPAITTALTELCDHEQGQAWAMRCMAWAANFTWERTTERLVNAGLAERERRLRRSGGEHRRDSDLVTWAEFLVTDPQDFAGRARTRLRAQDLWQLDADRARVLCHACDEQDLVGVGQRLGVELMSAHIATRAHLLGDLVPALGRPADLEPALVP